MLRSDWRLAATAQMIEASNGAHRRRPIGPRTCNAGPRWWPIWRASNLPSGQGAERQLRTAGMAVIPYLETLDRQKLDFEQWTRISRIIDSRDDVDEDTPEVTGNRLMTDRQIWLALAERPQASAARAAGHELSFLLNEPVQLRSRCHGGNSPGPTGRRYGSKLKPRTPPGCRRQSRVEPAAGSLRRLSVDPEAQTRRVFQRRSARSPEAGQPRRVLARRPGRASGARIAPPVLIHWLPHHGHRSQIDCGGQPGPAAPLGLPAGKSHEGQRQVDWRSPIAATAGESRSPARPISRKPAPPKLNHCRA